MKRFISIILIALSLSLSSLFADEKSATKSFRLQGGYDNTIAVQVKGIAALEMQGLVGMPFDIQDKSVLSSNKGNGREIAKWSMLSNTPFYVIVEATSMHNKALLEGQWTEENSLDYQMVMSYELVYDHDGSTVTKSANLIFDTEKKSQSPSFDSFPQSTSAYETTFKYDIFSDLPDTDSNMFVGSLDGSIYFKFTDSSSIKVYDDDVIPKGNYTAVVKITLETKE